MDDIEATPGIHGFRLPVKARLAAVAHAVLRFLDRAYVRIFDSAGDHLLIRIAVPGNMVPVVGRKLTGHLHHHDGASGPVRCN